jgi:acyl-CoA synthetase (AMP-forming)/AMP-acid ligase II
LRRSRRCVTLRAGCTSRPIAIGKKESKIVTICEILRDNARRYGAETALVERDPVTRVRRVLTWAEFDRQADRLARGLASRGVGKGDRVILLLKNCLEWLPAYFGILRTGAWAVPLNHRFSPAEARWCAETAEAGALIYGEEYGVHFEPPRGSAPLHLCLGGARPAHAEDYAAFLAAAPDGAPDGKLGPDDEAALYFTSGTTGRPKPILLTHANLLHACVAEQAHHFQTHADNFLCIPPLYHTGAKMHWFGNFLVGAPAVILKGARPEWILEAVSEEGCTIVWLLVPWAQDILDAVERGEVDPAKLRLGQWRLMHIGAQPVPPSLVKRWLEVFPHHQYDTNYGLSESTGPGCVHLGIGNVGKVGAIGIPGKGWEARIVREDGSEAEDGVVGEVSVRGPGVMKGYYKNPEATAAVLKDGWLLTGDLGRRDEEGFIYLVDRKKDLVIVGGENVFPVEVEDFLRTHPAVRDAAVIGAPHARLVEIVVAVVDAKPGHAVTEEDLLLHCEALPRYKRPHRIYFDAVPRNPTGKIEKPKLREKYGGRVD